MAALLSGLGDARNIGERRLNEAASSDDPLVVASTDHDLALWHSDKFDFMLIPSVSGRPQVIDMHKYAVKLANYFGLPLDITRTQLADVVATVLALHGARVVEFVSFFFWCELAVHRTIC